VLQCGAACFARVTRLARIIVMGGYKPSNESVDGLVTCVYTLVHPDGNGATFLQVEPFFGFFCNCCMP